MLADTLRSIVDGPAGRAALTAGSAVLERRATRTGRPPVLAVVTYHRVAPADERPDLHPGLRSASPEGFDAQMAWLAANTNVVGLPEVLEARRGGRALPERAVLVTFDDAYADFATGAWPALRRHGVPATMFVPTAYPDTDRTFWWDRLHHALTATRQTAIDLPDGRVGLGSADERAAAFRRLRRRVPTMAHGDAMAWVDTVVAAAAAPAAEPATLSWEQLGQLAETGVTLAPHSRTHPLLHRLDPADLPDELVGSTADLQARIPAAVAAFAYPGGGHDDTVVAATADAGLEVAFTTERGLHDPRRPDWLRIPRLNVGARAGIPLLRAQLLPATHRVLRVASSASRRHPWN